MKKSFQECSDIFGKALDKIWKKNHEMVDDAGKYLQTRARLLQESCTQRTYLRTLNGIAAPYDQDEFEETVIMLDAFSDSRAGMRREKIVE